MKFFDSLLPKKYYLWFRAGIVVALLIPQLQNLPFKWISPIGFYVLLSFLFLSVPLFCIGLFLLCSIAIKYLFLSGKDVGGDELKWGVLLVITLFIAWGSAQGMSKIIAQRRTQNRFEIAEKMIEQIEKYRTTNGVLPLVITDLFIPGKSMDEFRQNGLFYRPISPIFTISFHISGNIFSESTQSYIYCSDWGKFPVNTNLSSFQYKSFNRKNWKTYTSIKDL